MAVHHDEQQGMATAAYFWKQGGKWLFAVLVAAAVGYLGYVVYQNHAQGNNEKAAVLAVQVKDDVKRLQSLQQQYPHTAAAVQATLQLAAAWFQAGKTDDALKAYQWVLDNQKEPVFQAASMKNMANIYLQQKKYDEALKVLATPLPTAFDAMVNESRGDVYAAQGKTKEAAAAYKLVLDKLPENSANRTLVQQKANQL